MSRLASSPLPLITSEGAQFPSTLVGLRLETLRAIPLNFNNTALIIDESAPGIFVELVGATGPIRSWCLAGGQGELQVDSFESDGIAGEAIVGASTLTLDLRYSGALKHTGYQLLKSLGITDTHHQSHVTIEFKPANGVVVLHLNQGDHLSVKLPEPPTQGALPSKS